MWVWVIVSLFVFVLWLIGNLTRVKKMDGWTVLGSVILANTIQMQKKWKSWLQDRGRWNVTFNILGKYEEIWTVMKKYGNMEGHLYRKKLQDCPLSTIWTTWYGNVQECRLFLKWLRKISLHCYIFLCMYMHFFLSFFFFVFFLGSVGWTGSAFSWPDLCSNADRAVWSWNSAQRKVVRVYLLI